MKRSSLRPFCHKLLCGGSALAIAASMVGLPAFAQTAQAESASVKGYVTCASYRAAEPTPEILGLSNVGTNNAWEADTLNWSSPYLKIFGDTEFNSNPNPYMVNTITNITNKNEDATPTLTKYASRQGGPTASMSTYAKSAESAAIWDLLPDVILGNSSKVNYNTDEYAGAAADANNASDYKTYGAGTKELGMENDDDYGVVYDSTNIYTMFKSMYNLAKAGDKAAAATGKSLRYGDATDIAAQFEEYVKGQQGAVLKAIDEGKVKKKSVAVLAGYDKDSGTYKLIKTGVSEGTATANRYLEATQFVATNIADESDRATVDVTTGQQTTTYATATKADLEKVDLIMIGSQTGMENLTSASPLMEDFTADMQAKTYWTGGSGSAGSCYGVVMNSVENAQNTGRILGCLYPEVIDQSDMIAYYYQNFYHIASGKLSEAIDLAMDGVRNYNNTGGDALNWSKSDVADYSEAKTSSVLAEGMTYLEKNKQVIDYLDPSDNYDASDYGKAVSDRIVEAQSQTITTAQGSWSKTYSKATFNLGAKAKTALSYKSSNSKVATVSSNGTVTLKGAGTCTITVSAAATDEYRAATKTVTVKVSRAKQKVTAKVSKKTLKAKKLKKKAATFSIGAKAKTPVTYKSSTKKITVSKAGKVKVKKGTKKGTYRVTVKAAKTAQYNAASKTIRIVVK